MRIEHRNGAGGAVLGDDGFEIAKHVRCERAVRGWLQADNLERHPDKPDATGEVIAGIRNGIIRAGYGAFAEFKPADIDAPQNIVVSSGYGRPRCGKAAEIRQDGAGNMEWAAHSTSLARASRSR